MFLSARPKDLQQHCIHSRRMHSGHVTILLSNQWLHADTAKDQKKLQFHFDTARHSYQTNLQDQLNEVEIEGLVQ